MNTRKMKPIAPSAKTDHVDELIDEAGKESFPASDPPAVTSTESPSRPSVPERRKRQVNTTPA